MKLWSLYDMIYRFKVGTFAESIEGVMSEVDMLIFRRQFHDYDFDKHCGDIVKRLSTLRERLGPLQLPPALAAQWENCELSLPRFSGLLASWGIMPHAPLRCTGVRTRQGCEN
jgi:hypothetical protein